VAWPRLMTHGLSRRALFVVGASAAVQTMLGCGSSTGLHEHHGPGSPRPDSGGMIRDAALRPPPDARIPDAAVPRDARLPEDGAIAQPYGAPPPDAAPMMDAGIAPPYGAAPSSPIPGEEESEE